MSGSGADEGGRTWSRHYRRPYTVTGGRTRPAHDDLELETLVQTVTGIDEQLAGLGREQRSIAALCREVVSVAEISGRLDLLLGVTRVIVGDMALQGVVVLYRPQATVADADLPPVELLKRVLHASRTSRSDLRRAVVLLVGCALLAAGCTVGGRHGGGTHAGGSPRIEETRRRAM